MTRLLLLLVLLSGCAASRLPAGGAGLPVTLAEVNTALAGERVRIELGDRYVIAEATRVSVSATSVAYHYDLDPRDSLRTLPISSVERILRVNQPTRAEDGGSAAVLGAITGAVLLGTALSEDVGGGAAGEQITGGFAKGFAVVASAVVMAVGASLSAAPAKRRAARRRALVYRGPVERYLVPASDPAPARPAPARRNEE